DDQGCQAESNIIVVTPKTVPTQTYTQTNVSCNGSSDGSIVVTAADGIAPYQYSIDNGATFQVSNVFNGLAAGAYNVVVRDSKSCISVATVVTITQPTPLAASASTTAFSCSVTNAKVSAVITIAVPTTGTAPYQYSFNNGASFSSTNTLTVNDNGADQTFTYVVKDANGCLTVAQTITLTALNPPTDLAFTSAAVTCTATTTTVNLTATNGVGTLQYETIAPSPIIRAKQASNSFAGLTPGTYVFQVTDANGCYYSESYTIVPVTPIAITGTKLSDVLCNGDNTGAIKFTVSGYSGTYTSILTSGAGILVQSGNTVDITGLIADTYTIRVTDDITGCFDEETIIITEPTNPLTFTVTSTNVFCTNNNSQITVTAIDGTPSYTYAAVITGNLAPLAAAYGSSNVITVDTNSAADLVWDVYIKDANGCITVDTITIINDVLPTVTTPPLASNQCTVSTGFTFTATGTGLAPLSYSINGGISDQASPTFVVNVPGTYFVTVKDKNGCTATSSTSTVVYAPLNTNAILTKDLTCSAPTDATIDVTTAGGNAPYSYKVKIGAGTYGASVPFAGATFTYTVTTADTYQFEITDTNGCTKETNVITTTAIVNPDITNVVQTQFISCNSDETAAIDITIDDTKGLAPFVFNVLNTTTSFDYGTQTSGLAAGDYTITVTDAKGCTDTFNITIVEPNAIDFDLTKVDITCSSTGGSSLGSITVENIVGGTAPFTYYITNNFGDVIPGSPHSAISNEDHTFSIINFGIYTINVIDANGCSLTKQITMASPPSDLDIDVTTLSSDCTNGGTAIVEAISTVGSNNYEFGILEFNSAPYTLTYLTPDSPGGAIKTFTNLTPGVVYTFVVHDLTTNCYFVKSADTPIAPASALTSTVVANNVVCKGENNGSVTFTIDNFDSTTASVDYEIFRAFSNVSMGPLVNIPVTFGTPETVIAPSPASLSPGQYYITFTENGTGLFNGCKSASAIFEINESAIDLSVSATVSKNENCNELGVISAIGKDGTAPYTYQLLLSTDPAPIATSAGWSSANTFTATADSYIVYVKDAYGCIKFDAANLQKDPEPTINPIAPQCFDGTPINITLVEVTGTAIAPLTYSIGGAYQSSATFSINVSGTYNVFIKDGNGCIATTTYVVQSALLLDANMTQDLTCTVDASITLTPSGGTGTYTAYAVSTDGGTTYTAASSTYTATADGTYQFRVIDDQGCQAESNIIIVTPKTTPTFTFSQTNATCNGDSDGSIVVTAANGIAPYEYSMDNGTTFQASNVFSGLLAGPYDVVVRDSKNCDSAPTTVTITEPLILAGTGALTQGLTCGLGNATQAAEVTVTGSGGTAPYTYSFDGGVNYTSTNAYSTYTSGTVTAYVRDANGCTIPVPISVVVPALDVPTDLAFSATAVTCLALTSDVTLTTTNGVGTLSYAILSPSSATGNVTGASSGTFTGLAPDTYMFEVTDANGCTYQESYTVVPVTNISVAGLKLNDVYCFGGNTGAIGFTVSDYAGSYTTTILSGAGALVQTGNTIDFTGLIADTYTIRVTDDITGCTADATIIVTEPSSALSFTATPTHVYCSNDESQITVIPSGGTASYTYAAVISGNPSPAPAAYGTSDVVTVDTNSGTDLVWDVYVRDANACTTMNTVTVILDPLPTVSTPPLASNQCTVTSGFTFTVFGETGVGPFTYSINGGASYQASATFTVNAPGTYTVTIKDNNGCTATSATATVVYEPLNSVITLTKELDCTGSPDAEITGTITGGLAPYTYEVSINGAAYASLGATGTPYTYTTASSGTYQFRITDANSCQAETSIITIDALTTPTLSETHTNVSCNGDSDGSIVVTAANGIAPYQFSIDNGTTFQASNVFSGLALGVYDVVVRDSKSCVSIATSVSITEPALVGGTIALTQNLTCGLGNATQAAEVTVTGSGGTAPYTYSFDGG
ncbi:SprB-like repeat protein, partial [Mariniflexile fucanivorans]